jgi:hypothetical protein
MQLDNWYKNITHWRKCDARHHMESYSEEYTYSDYMWVSPNLDISFLQ